MLRFCAMYGIEVNKEAIWQVVRRFDTVAASAQRTCAKWNKNSSKPEQMSLNLGPRSGWRTI